MPVPFKAIVHLTVNGINASNHTQYRVEDASFVDGHTHGVVISDSPYASSFTYSTNEMALRPERDQISMARHLVENAIRSIEDARHRELEARREVRRPIFDFFDDNAPLRAQQNIPGDFDLPQVARVARRDPLSEVVDVDFGD